MERFASQYGYVGIFLVSLLGASSVIVPIPYPLVIYFAGSFLDPFLVGLTSGIGSALGEISGYALGYYGRAIVGEERKRRMGFILRALDRYGPFIVFLFALTPLPDDLLFIPLGIIRYDLWRALLPAALGKILISYVIALGGKYSIGIIRDLFGEAGWPEIVISFAVLTVIMLLLLRVDWEKIVTRRFDRESQPK